MERFFLFTKEESTAAEFNNILESDFTVDTFFDEDESIEALSTTQYSCIVLDVSKIQNILEHTIYKYLISSDIINIVPVTVINDTQEFIKELTLLNKGCYDIFHLNNDPVVANKRFKNVITISSLRQNVQTYEKKLITDPMTGLLNRDGFQAEVRKYLKSKTPGTFIMCDMDNLKYINDNFSHQTGDFIINGVANQLKESMPEKSVITHMSGDEFALFIPDETDKDTLSTICADFLKALERNVLLPDYSRPVTASMGISFYPENATTFESLYTKADHALLFVKNHGKGNFKFHASRDDREELLKGRQECTNVSMQNMLKKRTDEDIQTWLKFGEFRIVYLTFQKYSNATFYSNLFSLNIQDPENNKNTDNKKITSLNEKITTFIKESQLEGIFSWYSINQLLILSTDKEKIDRGIAHLTKEIEAEVTDMQLSIKFEKYDSNTVLS